ncbi:hypothetical protein [Sodalis sp.]
MLILDEPTHDLDVETLELLESFSTAIEAPYYWFATIASLRLIR